MYPYPPTDGRGPVQLFPPGQTPRGQFNTASLMRSHELLPNMLRAIEGRELVQDGYDSDDGASRVVCCVLVLRARLCVPVCMRGAMLVSPCLLLTLHLRDQSRKRWLVSAWLCVGPVASGTLALSTSTTRALANTT